MPDSSNHLGPVDVQFREPSEEFHMPGDYSSRPPTLGDYWQWSSSNVLNNTERGIMAEYLVAHALGLTDNPRVEWDSVDLRTGSGLKIEIKSAAYLQSWSQRQLSPISFGIEPKRREWDAEADTVVLHDPPKRIADLYVFCLLKHKDKSTVNTLDTDQWEFYVVPTWRIDKERSGGKRIGLRPLRGLAQGALGFGEIADAVGALEQLILSRAESLAVSTANNAAPVKKVVSRRSKLTEAEFYEQIEQKHPELPPLIRHFFEQYQQLGTGFTVTLAKASYILHWYSRDGLKHNFGTFFPSGELKTNYIARHAERSGDLEIGETYLQAVADLIPGATVLKKGNNWTWRVVVDGKLPLIKDALVSSYQWLMAISQAVNALNTLTGDE